MAMVPIFFDVFCPLFVLSWWDVISLAVWSLDGVQMWLMACFVVSVPGLALLMYYVGLSLLC
jgi:hypothetical protein